MNAPIRSFRTTILARMVMMYLIIILPVLLLGVYLYNWSYNNASRDLSTATMAQLTDYLGDLTRELDWIEMQQFDILEDNHLNRLAVTWDMMSSVERRTSLNELFQRLATIKTSSDYIKDIRIHVRKIDKTLSVQSTMQNFDTKSYSFFRSIPYKSDKKLISYNGLLHMIAIKQSGVKGDEPLFIVQVELDNRKLRSSLGQVNLYPGSRSYLLAEDSTFALGNDEETDNILKKNMTALREVQGRWSRFKADGRQYHIDKAFSEQLDLSVANFLPMEEVRRPLAKFKMWAWLFALASLCAVSVYTVMTYRMVHRPLLQLVKSFRRMEDGSLDIQIEHKHSDEFGYLYQRFNQMIAKLQILIDQDFKQKLMMQKAELKQLQSQINPHFLYNSFFILNSLSKTGDVERIEQFTGMLGEYFRFITRNGEDYVKLSEEIRHSRMYTEIQKLRFSRRIQVQFDELPEELRDIRVPRLITQPLIENAYEHSLEKLPEEGMLRVSFESSSGEARIVIEDNGNELDDAGIKMLQEKLLHPLKFQEMTGMMNIHRRISLIHGDGGGLEISRSGLGGLKVMIRIGLRGKGDDV